MNKVEVCSFVRFIERFEKVSRVYINEQSGSLLHFVYVSFEDLKLFQ